MKRVIPQKMVSVDIRTGLPIVTEHNSTRVASAVPSYYPGTGAPLQWHAPGFVDYQPQNVGQIMDYTETAVEHINASGIFRCIFAVIVIIVCTVLILLLLVFLSVI